MTNTRRFEDWFHAKNALEQIIVKRDAAWAELEKVEEMLGYTLRTPELEKTDKRYQKALAVWCAYKNKIEKLENVLYG